LNQWDLLAPVDPAFDDPPDPARDRIELRTDDLARASVEAQLTALGVPPDTEIVVMHVGAGNEFRRWPEESFAQVAAALSIGRDRTVVLIGSSAESASVEKVVAASKRANASARVVAAAGWSLAELRALCDRASLFVGGDSGPMHIAATSDVPIVAVFGPTLPVHWAPWRPAQLPFIAVEPDALECRPCDQRVCAPGDFRCLRNTGPDRVIEAARRLLERH
jgi:ADP-heptose:LPS heptosyltransferase